MQRKPWPVPRQWRRVSPKPIKKPAEGGFCCVTPILAGQGGLASECVADAQLAALPYIEGFGNPVEQSGEDWFNSLSEADQQRLMGKEFYSAWKDGLFELKDMPHKVEDVVYGNMTTARPLWDLLGAEPPLRTE